MDLTITLPDHVAAAFATEEDAEALALAALTAHARAQAIATASDEANAIVRAASAPFDGTEPPTVQTVAERIEAATERIEQVAERTVLLAGTLATLPSVGGDPAEVQAAISEVVGGAP